MFRIAIPILGVESSVRAEAFYTKVLGFEKVYAYRPDPERADPCYLGLQRDQAHVVVSSFAGDGPPGARGTQIYVDDVKAVHAELTAKGLVIEGGIFDQDYGNLEFGIDDPDGNGIVFSQDKNG